MALENEIMRVNLDTDERTSIAPIPDGNGSLRCNDGKCDPEGRFWIRNYWQKEHHPVQLLVYSVGMGEVVTKLIGLTNSNGIIWSGDKNSCIT